MRNLFFKIMVVMGLLLLQTAFLSAGETLNVTDDGVRMRSKDSTKGRIVGKLNKGDSVTVLKVGRKQRIGRWGRHYWYRVRANRRVGWVFGAFLSSDYVSSDDESSSSSGTRFVIKRNNVILRGSDSTKSRVVAKLYLCDVVTRLSKGRRQTIRPWGRHSWHEVETEDGKVGWVFGAFLRSY